MDKDRNSRKLEIEKEKSVLVDEEDGPVDLDQINEITERSMEESPLRPTNLQSNMPQSNASLLDATPKIIDQDPNRIDLMNQENKPVNLEEEKKESPIGAGLGVTDSNVGPSNFQNMF